MRGFLTFAVVVGLGGLYLWQKQHEAADTPAAKAAQTSSATAELTPAPRGQASEYNWMKRSLDRAATVRDQARDQSKAAQNP